MTIIIDYGAGNLRSVQKAIESLGVSAKISNQPAEIASAKKIILPGVGAFGQAMASLNELELVSPIKDAVTNNVPFLGICLGMQLLLSFSEEHGKVKGLDLIPGQVTYFRNNPGFSHELVVPHMGWNTVKKNPASKLLSTMPAEFQAYFVHSYYAAPIAKEVVVGSTLYGIDFCSVIEKNNIYGVQFHPEKSGRSGLQILKNFIENC